MSQNNNLEPEDEMRDEYNFSGGETVNQALRTLITIARNQSPQPR